MQPTSVTLVPVNDFYSLNVGDLIVFKQRLYKICEVLPKPDPANNSVRLEVLSGEPDDASTGWRAFTTLTKNYALKLTFV
jgi:hypothetical protein